MRQSICVLGTFLALTATSNPGAADEGPEFHEDYYLGFSQGAYYGLMLAGIEYDVAWCVKGELDYEAGNLGSGSDFQENIESIFRVCSDGE